MRPTALNRNVNFERFVLSLVALHVNVERVGRRLDQLQLGFVVLFVLQQVDEHAVAVRVLLRVGRPHHHWTVGRVDGDVGQGRHLPVGDFLHDLPLSAARGQTPSAANPAAAKLARRTKNTQQHSTVLENTKL
jgi:hypothetical protein